MPPIEPIDAASIAEVALRCFRGEDGRRLLRYLRAITVERTLGPAADNRQLRHLEGQRQLVQHLAALIQRAESGPAPESAELDDI